MKDLIELQNAHVTKTGGAGAPWNVEANISNDPLHELPAELTEKEVFAVLEFARKFENRGFQAGIAFQKQLSGRMYKGQIAQLKDMNLRAGNENQRLAAKLETLIGEKE